MEQVLLSGFLITLSIFDCKECKVPVVLISGEILATMLCVLCRCVGNPTGWKWIVLSALLGIMPGVFLLGAAYVTGKIGYGDGLVLMGVGMLTGYKECLVLICFSLLLMSAWCIGLLCRKKGNRNTRIPYIPFLTVVYLMRLFI